MNPGIAAAVAVVGAIAAALYFVFTEPPQVQAHSNRNRNNDNVYNYHFNTYSTNNYYPSDESKDTGNESKSRKKRRQRAMWKNDNCGICLEFMAGASELVEILVCDHACHAKCLDEYSESQKVGGHELRCPLCRHLIE